MPRKPRRRNAKKLSEDAKAGLAKVGETVPAETLEYCLDDFDIQVTKMTRQYSQDFQKTAKKFLKNIPTKTSLPGVIAKMSLYEFRRRGNTVEAVLKSLQRESSVEEMDTGPVLPLDVGEVSSFTKENRDPLSVATAINVDLVTPALNTRSRRAVDTTARKPRPMEELKVYAQSKATGSPIDEGAVLEAHVNTLLSGMGTRVMDRLMNELPQCHRRKVMRAIKEIKAEMLSTEKDITKTPALLR